MTTLFVLIFFPYINVQIYLLATFRPCLLWLSKILLYTKTLPHSEFVSFIGHSETKALDYGYLCLLSPQMEATLWWRALELEAENHGLSCSLFTTFVTWDKLFVDIISPLQKWKTSNNMWVVVAASKGIQLVIPSWAILLLSFLPSFLTSFSSPSLPPSTWGVLHLCVGDLPKGKWISWNRALKKTGFGKGHWDSNGVTWVCLQWKSLWLSLTG